MAPEPTGTVEPELGHQQQISTTQQQQTKPGINSNLATSTSTIAYGKPPPLPWKLKICYGLGHVWNDLCASLWFTYLLLFLKFALGFDENSAGVLMLIGQVADAVATPLAGLQVDKKYSSFTCWNYGHRKTWHLIGTAAVLASFPFIFENCLLPECYEILPDPALNQSLLRAAAGNNMTWLNASTTSANNMSFMFNHDWFNASNGSATVLNATVRNVIKATPTSGVSVAKTIYFAFFISVFQFGWAAVQIAHLSLIPCLTHCQHQRTELNAIRYGFTVLSNIAVYLIAWIILGLADRDDGGRISAQDTSNFRNISLISTGIGAVFTILFHIGVKEDPLPVKTAPSSASMPAASSSVELTTAAAASAGTVATSASTDDAASTTGTPVRRIKFYEWFKTREFYEVGWIYQTTRLFFNVSQVYITLYLQETLSLGHQSVATIPLIMFIGGFAATLFLKKLNKKVGRKVAYGIGFLLGMISTVWIWAGGTRTSYKEIEVYFVAVILGASGSILLVTSLSITADLIGPNSANGGFIYGAMSFADKMTNGFAIMLIQYLNPCQNVADCPTNPYPGTTLIIGCGGSAILGMLGVLFMKNHDHDAGVFNMKHPIPNANILTNKEPPPNSYTNPVYQADLPAAGTNEASSCDTSTPTFTRDHQNGKNQ